MNNDPRTFPYKLTYFFAMLTIVLSVVVGAFWMQRSPSMQGNAIIALLKRPLYATELYAQTGALSAVSLLTTRHDNRASKDAATSIPVLVYHGIIDEADGSTINFTEEEFKRHVFALKREGYETATLAELSRFLRGEIVLPEKTVVITFDDGRADSFYEGDPILSVAGYEASMFAIGRYAEESHLGSYYLTLSELARMEESDTWEIGAHSYDGHHKVALDEENNLHANFYSGRMWLPEKRRQETPREFTDRIEGDLTRSQDVLAQELNKPISALAFPFGDFGQHVVLQEPDIEAAVVSAAKERYQLLFYQEAPREHFTQNYVTQHEKESGGLFVYRINMTNDIDSRDLLAFLSRGSAKPLPFQAQLREDDGWVRAWGDLQFSDGDDELVLDSLGRSSGAAMVLDGTKHWKNYQVSATVSSQNGANTVLWVRFQDEFNTAACNFGDTFTHINQVVNGDERVIRGVEGTAPLPDEPFVIEARVFGRELVCLRDGEEMVRTEFLDPALSFGGVGFKTWQEAGSARMSLYALAAHVLHESTIEHENTETQNEAQISDE